MRFLLSITPSMIPFFLGVLVVSLLQPYLYRSLPIFSVFSDIGDLDKWIEFWYVVPVQVFIASSFIAVLLWHVTVVGYPRGTTRYEEEEEFNKRLRERWLQLLSLQFLAVAGIPYLPFLVPSSVDGEIRASLLISTSFLLDCLLLFYIPSACSSAQRIYIRTPPGVQLVRPFVEAFKLRM